jgi:long-chain acyl-CoA synthetase
VEQDFSPAHRGISATIDPRTALVTYDHLLALIRRQIAATPDGVAMRHKVGAEWQGITYAELGRRMDAVASWLIDNGVAPGDRVVIYAHNSPWWTVADLAIMASGAISVPIYATNTAHQAEHIICDAGATFAFVGGPDQYSHLAGVRGLSGPIAKVLCFDASFAPEMADSWALSSALAHPVSPALAGRAAAARTDDAATIIYTSGTTGEPKGVVLTFENLVVQFDALDRFFSVTGWDRSLCFLPLSHAYERAWTFYILSRGAQNFYLDDPRRVLEAMQEVRPTCMVSVPRLYEKIYATARHKVSEGSGAKRKLFEWAVKVGGRYAHAKKRGGRVGPVLAARHALADRLVLHKIRDIVGGPKNFFSAGGAALAAEIEEFFFSAGLLVCQGYGLTETSPMLTCNRPGDFRFGTVGKVIPGCELKIAPDGEILARGPNVTRGYFGRPKETAEVFENGWFKTGDIGEFDEDGFLRITDRKKDLIITSGGKNIAPSRIESIIAQDYYIEQVAAVGDGRHHVAALVVPHFEALELWAKERGITFDSFMAMVKDHRIVDFIGQRIDERQRVLPHHERVKKFTLLTERFSQMGGELTPTLKNIRAAIAEKYAHAIESMYAADKKDETKLPRV